MPKYSDGLIEKFTYVTLRSEPMCANSFMEEIAQIKLSLNYK